MMPTRTPARALLIALLAFAGPALAQDAPARPGPGDAKAPARADSALQAARDAVAALSSLAYTATYSVQGEKPAKAVVLIKKAEAGGSKLYARTGEGEAQTTAAYDGLSVRAVDPARKIVWDHSTEKVSAIRSVFAIREIDQPVIWELLGDEDWATAEAAHQGSATVDGVACDVIALKKSVDRPRLAPNAAPGGGGEAPPAKPEAKPGDAAPKPESASVHEVRLFIGKSDRLPHRVIRRAGPSAKPVTINLTEIETDKAIPDSYFNLDAPDGYTVKEARPSPAPRPDGARTITRKPDPEPGQAAFGLAIGAEAPAFTLKDAAGKDHALADYRGKVVLLDFWGSWCPPCRMAMPGVQKLHERYKDKPVAVLGLNFEQSPKADPAKFMKDQGYTYGLLLKAETIARDYKISGWPTFYVIDQQGKIVWSALGYDPGHEEEIVGVIDGLLAK